METEAARLDLPTFRQLAPETERALLAISAATRTSTLGPELAALVRVRASELNGCAFCTELHVREARAQGVSEARLEALHHWRDASLFGPRERAALAWTEALTHLVGGDVPDALYRDVTAVFSDAELAALTSVVVTINAWNRIALAYRFQHGQDVRRRG